MFVVNRAPSRGGACEMTMSCCTCEPLDGGYMVTDFAAVLRGPLCRRVASLAIDGCSHKDAGRSERKTQTVANVTTHPTIKQAYAQHTTSQYDTLQQSARCFLIPPKCTHHLAQFSDHMCSCADVHRVGGFSSAISLTQAQ